MLQGRTEPSLPSATVWLLKLQCCAAVIVFMVIIDHTCYIYGTMKVYGSIVIVAI